MSPASLAATLRDACRQYAQASAQPLVSLAFVAPLLVIYETGVVLLGPQAVRNGADVWLRGWLADAGFGQYLLLPALTCGLLLAWHHARREPWTLDLRVLQVMWLEAATLAGLLVLLARWQSRPLLSWWEASGPATVIGFLGAGIYEELLFRLLLLPALIGGLRLLGLAPRSSLVLGLAVSSLLFAAAHYDWRCTVLGQPLHWAAGEAFEFRSFAFRASAGLCFGALFLARGFGIAAGAHALYDVLAAAL